MSPYVEHRTSTSVRNGCLGDGGDATLPGDQVKGVARPLLLVDRPFDSQPATPGNGAMNAPLAADHAMVGALHALTLNNDGTCEDQPGLRPEYYISYYRAYFSDPEGSKLCVCRHGAA